GPTGSIKAARTEQRPREYDVSGRVFGRTGWRGPRGTFKRQPWRARLRDVKPRHMSWSSQGGFERRGYHHGNLREALVEAALALIAKKGPAGFTIAEAARLAGVSPAAPYRHFRDAEALLAEVALRGFDRITAELIAAWNDGRP